MRLRDWLHLRDVARNVAEHNAVLRARANADQATIRRRERQIERAMSLVRAEFANGNIPERTTDALDAILSEDASDAIETQDSEGSA